MEFGSTPTEKNLLISAQFLHKELAIRIARRAIELDSLPYGLSKKPAVIKVSSFFNFTLQIESWVVVIFCVVFVLILFHLLLRIVLII